MRALAFSRDAGLNEDTAVEFVCGVTTEDCDLWRCVRTVEISESHGGAVPNLNVDRQECTSRTETRGTYGN